MTYVQYLHLRTQKKEGIADIYGYILAQVKLEEDHCAQTKWTICQSGTILLLGDNERTHSQYLSLSSRTGP